MSDGFPTHPRSAELGELGLDLVSDIVKYTFGWLMRPHHQELDFGIDGHIEAKNADRAVTGQMVAVQIKCGGSFFSERNRWGFVYRGERKHFNYLCKYPVPVLIVICNPDTKICYWTEFREAETQSAGQNWKITIPIVNDLRISKPAIEALLPATCDSLDRLSFYWAINKVIKDSGVIIMSVDREQIDKGDISDVKASFERLCSTKEIAFDAQGKVEFIFRGYEQDQRELFEIPEVRSFVEKLDRELPSLFYFARTEAPTDTLLIFLFCQARVRRTKKQGTAGKILTLEVEQTDRVRFLARHFPALNAMTRWVGMSDDENRVITNAVLATLRG